MARVIDNDDNRDAITLDLSAAVWGGLVGAVAYVVAKFLLLNDGLNGLWAIFRPIATIALRERVLDPDWEFSPIMLIIGIVIHVLLSILYALIITFILHRWGFLVGVLGGAALGLALYVINYYTFSLLFPWFFAQDGGWISAVSHVIFGAFAGGTYELLEENHARKRERI